MESLGTWNPELHIPLSGNVKIKTFSYPCLSSEVLPAGTEAAHHWKGGNPVLPSCLTGSRCIELFPSIALGKERPEDGIRRPDQTFSTNNVTRTNISKLQIFKQSNLTYLNLWIHHLTVSRIALHLITLYSQQFNWNIMWENDGNVELQC